MSRLFAAILTGWLAWSAVVPVAAQEYSDIEHFGIFSEGLEDNRAPQYVSPGVHYLLTPDFELGVRVGWGLNHDAANFFSNAGVGWRF